MLATESDGSFILACVEINPGDRKSFALPLTNTVHSTRKVLGEIFLVERRSRNGGKRVHMNGVVGIGADAGETAAAATKSNGDDTFVQISRENR